MENIKSWIFSIVLASITYSLIDFILPSSNKKTAHLILNMFFLLCVLMPLKNINFNKILPDFEKKKLKIKLIQELNM
ncbi:MAG: hypothetical protein LBJ32_04065 [Oscillospiraceae bacterium]|jgi:hypothetical protein|nr:hypothetical protein [Oscillospiraceae bacterium]